MRAETSYEIMQSIDLWVSSLPQKNFTYTSSEGGESELCYFDYVVDYKVRIIPRNPKSLGVTIWLSEGAVGFFVESYTAVASLLDCRVAKYRNDLSCGGTEPIRSIDGEKIIEICKRISNAEIEFQAVKIFGCLAGVFSDITLNDSVVLHSVVGHPKTMARILAKIGVARLIRVPYQPWWQ